MALIGLDNLVYVKMTDEKAETYDSLIHKIPGIIEASIEPSVNTASLYADDGLHETATSLGQITVSLNIAQIPTKAVADLLGHKVDAQGVLVKSSDDVAPYVAIAFRSRKSNGEYRYKWLFKGKFSLPKESHKTQEENISYQTETIEGVFMRRATDKQWEASIDSDDSTITESVVTNWFTKPYDGTTMAG